MKTMRHGFTLVELSIVLVILGLLIGGVLTGQSLIRAAELRSVTTESSRFQTAVYTFRDKYFALPGDMPNAFAYWGTAFGCTDVSVMSNAAGCNGDGNGQIRVNTGEQLRLWQELAAAGLIEGSYSGTYVASMTATPGTDVPRSKLGAGTGWGLISVNMNTYVAWPNSIPLNNWLQLGSTYATNLPIGSVLKPEEAYNIDMKQDDGLPGTGSVVGGAGFSSSGCLTGTGAASTYVLSTATKNCSIAFQVN